MTRKNKDAVEAAADYGIDIQMLIDNLKRTPAERIRRHQAALNAMKKLQEAKKKKKRANKTSSRP